MIGRKPKATASCGTIEIVKGNRVGRPVAVYVSGASGRIARHDFRSAADARAAARAAARATGWTMSENLNTRVAKCIDAPGGAISGSAEDFAKVNRSLARAAR